VNDVENNPRVLDLGAVQPAHPGHRTTLKLLSDSSRSSSRARFLRALIVLAFLALLAALMKSDRSPRMWNGLC
jgi:hypothetical protein